MKECNCTFNYLFEKPEHWSKCANCGKEQEGTNPELKRPDYFDEFKLDKS